MERKKCKGRWMNIGQRWIKTAIERISENNGEIKKYEYTKDRGREMQDRQNCDVDRDRE